MPDDADEPRQPASAYAPYAPYAPLEPSPPALHAPSPHPPSSHGLPPFAPPPFSAPPPLATPYWSTGSQVQPSDLAWSPPPSTPPTVPTRTIVLAAFVALAVVGLVAYSCVQLIDSGRTPTAAGPLPAPGDTIITGLGGEWTVLQTRTETSTVQWTMPAPTFLDGPRRMANLDAVATYWVQGRSDPLRYDVAVVERIAGWSGDATTDAATVVDAMQAGASLAAAEPVGDDLWQVRFTGPFDGREYLGNVIVGDHMMVVVSVGYLDATDQARAGEELASITAGVVVTPR